MDPVTLAYYATICGLLSLGAPRIGGYLARLGVGVLVGLGAAWALPMAKEALTGY